MKAKRFTGKIKEEKAYTTLVSVIIVGAIGISVALGLLLNSLNSNQTTFTRHQSAEARNIASACAETALQQIQSSTGYTGTENLAIGNRTCSYTVSDLGGQNRKIEATSTLNSVTSRIKIEIDAVMPNINITSWQEVADF